MRCRGLHGLANPAFLSRFLFPVLLRVAPYCVPGGIRVVSKGPRLSTVSGIIGPALCRIADTTFREDPFLRGRVNGQAERRSFLPVMSRLLLVAYQPIGSTAQASSACVQKSSASMAASSCARVSLTSWLASKRNNACSTYPVSAKGPLSLAVPVRLVAMVSSVVSFVGY